MPTLNLPTINEIILRLDALAGQISTTLLGLGPDDLPSAFDRTLRLIGETLDAE